MSFLAQVVVWLNALANAVGTWVLAPIAEIPGWLSITLLGAITGIVLLVIFKHTSNQGAIKRARDDIKAQLLAMKLFKENVFVTLRAQVRVLWGALRLLVLALVPTAVMALPMTLVLAQLALWYQARPLQLKEEAVLTVKLGGPAGSTWPKVSLEPTSAVEVTIGPLHVLSKREMCWNIRASQEGTHRLVFHVDGQDVNKELAIGGGFMRVSKQRPGWSGADIEDHPLLNPWEAPFAADAAVQSIMIDYPTRSSWIYGADYWVIYWFAVSLVVAFLCRKIVGVNI